MIRAWIAAGLFMLLIAFVWCNAIVLEKLTTEVVVHLDACEAAANPENDDESMLRHYQEAKKLWDAHRTYLSIVNKQSEIEDIAVSFEEARIALVLDIKEDFLSAVATIRMRVLQMRDMEKLSLGNLF